MVELEKITEENYLDAFHLKLAPGQGAFVSHPIRSLAQAYVCRDQCQPFKDNPVAIKLYQKKGFAETGNVFDDEIEMVLNL